MSFWTFREGVTAVHGLLFGVFFLLAAYALFVELLQAPTVGASSTPMPRWRRAYLVLTATAGWLAVLSGTFIVYPWYRAKPPAAADLHAYPRALLLSSPSTSSLHTLGMEWKEHVAFLGPIAFTMLAYVLCRYGTQVTRHPHMRRLLLVFAGTALLATGVAGGVGALLNKAAPTTGPATLGTAQATQGNKHVAY